MTSPSVIPSSPALAVFEDSLAPVEHCLNRESAAALLEMPANPRVQERTDKLAEKCNEGKLTPAERSEYEALIWADQFLGLLQTKARHFLKTHATT